MQITKEDFCKIGKKYENAFSFIAEFGAISIQSYEIDCTELEEKYYTQDKKKI